VKRAGLRAQRFHDLRHAVASFMHAQGVPLRVAQEVLSHSSIAVTTDLYSHLAPTATRDATERVGELLFGAS
jgi:integrase